MLAGFGSPSRGNPWAGRGRPQIRHNTPCCMLSLEGKHQQNNQQESSWMLLVIEKHLNQSCFAAVLYLQHHFDVFLHMTLRQHQRFWKMFAALSGAGCVFRQCGVDWACSTWARKALWRPCSRIRLIQLSLSGFNTSSVVGGALQSG